MAMTFHTLQNLTIKGLCIVVRNSDSYRDRLNAAEALHARILEHVLDGGLDPEDKRAVESTLAACGA